VLGAYLCSGTDQQVLSVSPVPPAVQARATHAGARPGAPPRRRRGRPHQRATLSTTTSFWGYAGLASGAAYVTGRACSACSACPATHASVAGQLSTAHTQVDDDAPPEAIKAAYRQLAKHCHPDLLGEDKGHNACVLVNEVWPPCGTRLVQLPRAALALMGVRPVQQLSEPCQLPRAGVHGPDRRIPARGVQREVAAAPAGRP